MRKTLAFLLCAAFVFAATAMAQGGTATDPLVTVTFARARYLEAVEKAALAKAQTMLDGAIGRFDSQLDRVLTEKLGAKVAQQVLLRVQDSLPQAGAWVSVTLAQGDEVSGPTGAQIMLSFLINFFP